jgi:hypothetical protein
MSTPSKKLLYLEASAYFRLRELGTEAPALLQLGSPWVLLFDEIALLELANSFRFGSQEEGRAVFELVQKLTPKSFLKPFRRLLQGEVGAVLDERPRPRWEMDEADQKQVGEHFEAFARGEFGPESESHLRERRRWLEYLGRTVDHLFEEPPLWTGDAEDFQQMVASWSQEGRREVLRKLLAEVMKTERPSALARKVEGKLFRCPSLAAFVKIPILKRFLYRVRYEDRKRSDAEEFIHLSSLAYADVLVSEHKSFRERFKILHPQKEAHTLEEFLGRPRASSKSASD